MRVDARPSCATSPARALARVEARAGRRCRRCASGSSARRRRALEADVRFAVPLPDRPRASAPTLGIEGAASGDERPRALPKPELAGEPADVGAAHALARPRDHARRRRVLSAALAGCGVEEVHLVARAPSRARPSHPDEPALLQALLERLRALDPDVLVGWNVVDFDLRVLARALRGAAACPADLGRVPGETALPHGPRARCARGAPRCRAAWCSTASRLVREALRLVDYRLETVARAVLGRGKKIDQDAPDAAREIPRLWREDPEALAAYNLEDARLVLEILAQRACSRSRSSGAASRACRSTASARASHRSTGSTCPSSAAAARGAERRARAQAGAACAAARCSSRAPGLFRHVAVFDFKSLYPSLIRTFQLDPLAHARAGDGRALVAPNGARFARERRDPARRDRAPSSRAARPRRRAATATPTRRSRS